MKTKTILSTALLAMAGLAMSGTSAFAKGGGSGISANSDDLILNIRATSGAGINENIEYDLGSFSSVTSGGSVNLPLNISSDITTYFGGSNTGLLWSVMGSNTTGDNNLYYTVVSGGTPNPNPTALTGQAGPAGTIGNLYTQIQGQTANTTATPTTAKGFAYGNSAQDSYSNLLTTSGNDNAQSFGYFNTSVENAANASGKFYENVEGTSSPQLLGTFTLSSGDVLSFAAAIPEPSTYALLGIGSLALTIWARRRKTVLA